MSNIDGDSKESTQRSAPHIKVPLRSRFLRALNEQTSNKHWSESDKYGESSTQGKDGDGRQSISLGSPGHSEDIGVPVEEEDLEAQNAPPRTGAQLRGTTGTKHHDRTFTPAPSLPSDLASFWNIRKAPELYFHRPKPRRGAVVEEELVERGESSKQATSSSGPSQLSPTTPTQKRSRFSLSTPSTLPSRPPPDGGYLAWAHACANFFTTFSTHGLPLAFGILLPFYGYVPLLGHSAAAVALIGSLSLGAPFLAAPLVEPLYAAGCFRWLFHGGSLGLAGALLGSSFCGSFGCLLATQGLLAALAGSCVFCAGVLVLQTYFEHDTGLAMGIGAAGASVGGVVYALLAQQLLPVIGLHWTLRVVALVTLVSLLLPNAMIRPRPLEEKSGASEESETGPSTAPWTGIWDTEFALLAVGLVLVFLTLYFPYYYLPTYAILALRTPPTTASTLLLTLLALTLPSRLLARPLTSRLGPLTALTLSTLLAALAPVLLIPTASLPALHVLAAFYGASSAAVLSLYTGAVEAVVVNGGSGRGPGAGAARKRRAVLGVGVGVAAVAGPVAAGVLMEVGVRGAGDEGGFVAVQLWAGACLAAACVCFLGVRVMRAGWAWKRA